MTEFTLTPEQAQRILTHALPHIVSFSDDGSTVEDNTPLSPHFISISTRGLLQQGFTIEEIKAFEDMPGAVYDGLDYDPGRNRDRHVFCKPELEKIVAQDKKNPESSVDEVLDYKAALLPVRGHKNAGQ